MLVYPLHSIQYLINKTTLHPFPPPTNLTLTQQSKHPRNLPSTLTRII